ncbi:MAG: helix-turn-helix domain-containing protein [Acidimicrobiales bacterium]
MQRVQSDLIPQRMQNDEQFLRAEDVGKILGVERSTVYRMAATGRLPAMKVGHQWRFPAELIAWMLDAHDVSPKVAIHHRALEAAVRDSLAYLELGAELLSVMLVITDMSGYPVTDIIHPCPWFRDNLNDPAVLAECFDDWRQLAEDPDFALCFRTGPHDFDCARTFVRVGPHLVGMLLAGGVAASDSDERELYHLSSEERARVLAMLPKLAVQVSQRAAEVMLDLAERREP